MLRVMFVGLLTVVVAAGTSKDSSAAFMLLDDFNRANSGTLGSNWTLQDGAIGVTSNQAQGTVDRSLSTYNAVTSNSVQMDIFAGSGLQYAAAVLGFADLNNNLFVKVQSNGSGPFDRLGFYFGNNGNNNGAWINNDFGSLSSIFTSARMTVTLVGSTVTLDLDTDFNGSVDQTYTRTGVPTGLLGTGIGIGTFGNTRIDNYGIITNAPNAVPEPSSMMLLGLGGLAMLRFVRQRKTVVA